jgi:hypothetical protein
MGRRTGFVLKSRFGLFRKGVALMEGRAVIRGVQQGAGELLGVRRIALAAVILALACVAASVGAGVASAARGHAFLHAFPNLEEPGHLSMSLVWSHGLKSTPSSGVAVDGVSHDVFVADTGNRRVDVFSAAGAFLRAWGWGVATGAGELQVCSASCLPGLSGSAPGEFEMPTFVAVDNDPSSASVGDVYVGDFGDALVSKFDGEGHLIGSWGNNGENAAHERVEPNGQLNGETSPAKEPFDGPAGTETIYGVTVDHAGNLWVLAFAQNLFQFTQAGGLVAQCRVTNLGSGATPTGLVTGVGGVYLIDGVGHARRVQEGKCEAPAEVASTVHPASGLAVDPGTEDLYVDAEGAFIEDIPAGCAVSGSSCLPLEVFGEGALGEGVGLAVDPGSGVVYVASVAKQQMVAFATVIEATQAPAGEVAAHKAVLRGTVNPLETELSRCEFEYGETEAYGSVVPCEESVAAIGNGSSPVPVQANVSGLDGGRIYHFRLRAASVKGGVHSEDERFETLATGRIVEVSASKVTGSGASLGAVVNPEGVSGTEYDFEYGECVNLAACPSSGYTTSTPVQPLATGTANAPVSQSISGLSAGTIYHFRAVVKDVNGLASPSPEGTFVLSPAGPVCEHARPQSGSDGLPDCRGYELVTPPDKNSALVDNGAFIPPPGFSADGSRVVTVTLQCFAESPSCSVARESNGVPYAFERTAGGWVAMSLAPPATFSGATTLRYDADSGLVLFAAPPGEGQPEQFYLRQQDGSLDPLGPLQEAPGLAVANEAVSGTLVATSDFSHVAYDGRHLWNFDESGNSAVYEYPGVDEHAVLANVTGEKGSTELIGVCGGNLGGNQALPNKYFGTLSSDGRTVVFTVDPCSTGTGKNAGVSVPAYAIYERIEGLDGKMRTVLVSGPGSGGACGKECLEAPAGDASYQGASADGSRVFFTSTQRLTDSASEDQRTGESAFSLGCDHTAPDTSGCNLYLWECPNHCEDEGDKRLVDVSAGDTSGLGPQVQGVVAVSPDGSSAYFMAHSVLTGANRQGVAPAPGGDNLYVYGPDGHGQARVAFVATLAPADERMWAGGIGVANVTPDGRFLVFTSARALTADVSRREGPAQVYRYDAQAEELVRVSIGQEGFDDNGNAGVAGANALIVDSSKGFLFGGRPDPSMSDDGRFVFFQSPVGLTPSALNDVAVTGNPKILAENVYEWQAFGTQASAGAPACGQPGGCVSLISDGRDVTEGSRTRFNETAVDLLGSDASGRDVFFETADRLVAGDTDSQVDFYDARVDGGFPASVEKTPCESLEECHGGGEAPEPEFAGGATSVFSGLGNVIPGASAAEGGAPRGEVSPQRRAHRLTPAEQLARALSACRKTRTGHGRMVCERSARAVYRAQLLASALAACRQKSGHARTVCERRAHAQYGAKAATGRKAAQNAGMGGVGR